MFYPLFLFLFLFGLIVGSFLNVVIGWLERERPNVFGRSRCDVCQKTLKWRELAPLLSFFLQKGRCRACDKKISWQYPLVEFSTGVLFLLAALKFEKFSEGIFVLISNLFFLSVLIIIFVYDLKHRLVPETVLIPAVAISVLLYFSNWPAAGLAAGFFSFLAFISKEKWLGWGDAEVALLMGFWLGFPGIFFALLLAFVSGAIYGIILICWRQKKLKSQIPFAPFLAVSTVLVWSGLLLPFWSLWWLSPF